MNTIAKVLGGVVGVAVVGAAGVSLWSRSAAAARLGKTVETHRVDFPIPFPLTEAERAEVLERERRHLPPDAPTEVDLLAGVDLQAEALARAIERGRHLAESRYACAECHGANFGGGVMIDAAPMGRFLGKNLTSGKGGVVGAYTPADWDRLVRHGVKPDGHPTVMPAMDHFEMSDRELSDLIAYIQSLPAVDAEVPDVTFGPLGFVLLATGNVNLAAEQVKDHQRAHPVTPPAAEDPAFGKVVAQPCVGCHGADLAGGPISGGDPAWPPSLNLTPHADGLQGWTYEEFAKVMRTAERRDGQKLRMPMAAVAPYAQKMTEPELKALFAYLQSVPAKPSRR